MTTEERIEDLVELVGDGDLYRYEASEMIVELLEKFAIDFGQWLLNQPYRVKYNDKEELLEIYKKHVMTTLQYEDSNYREKQEQEEKDKLAIGFAEWTRNLTYRDWHASTTEELLETYKKTL